MSIVEVLGFVGAGAGGISAIAAAVSARTNLTSVRRANLPFVYGEPTYGRAPGVYKTHEEADNAPDHRRVRRAPQRRSWNRRRGALSAQKHVR
jgi:hypothetical protein